MREWFMGRKGCEVGGGAPGGRNGGLSIEGVAAAAAAAWLVSIAARAAVRAAVRARALVPATAWALVPATAWALAALLCLAAPARAFWGDYGPEPRPEIFGVRLGDDIRNYKGMIRLPPPRYFAVFREMYQRKEEKGLTFAGVPLREDDPDLRPYYVAYKNKIYDISFYVNPEDYERTVQKISAMFGPPRGYRWRPTDTDSGYIWMNSEVFIESSRQGSFYVQWLPIEKKLYGYYAVKWNKPVVLGGWVTLGDKVEDYPFLKETYREGPDVTHYVSESLLPYDLKSCIFSAYKGLVYGFALVFKDNVSPWSSARFMLDLPYDPEDFPHFFGDVQVDRLWDNKVHVQLTPAYWEANRARLAYYRNVKPD